MGNYLNINNIYGFFNCFGVIIFNYYQVVELYDIVIVIFGDVSGNLIGYVCVKLCEFSSNFNGMFGDVDDIYKLNFFDV